MLSRIAARRFCQSAVDRTGAISPVDFDKLKVGPIQAYGRIGFNGRRRRHRRQNQTHAHLRQSKFISLIIISETLSVNSGWPASANGVFCR